VAREEVSSSARRRRGEDIFVDDIVVLEICEEAGGMVVFIYGVGTGRLFQRDGEFDFDCCC